ncbi:hypothetical protein ACMD2_22654 [Ananas comosus]|uniref:Uncharacterized protein n=1 Tax=Ananas comosus TaxID=4615 RepID=A0A199UUA8_ANACO|nr:hypothetical protein ACMD2_22654 [Ananas comosus]
MKPWVAYALQIIVHQNLIERTEVIYLSCYDRLSHHTKNG